MVYVLPKYTEAEIDKIVGNGLITKLDLVNWVNMWFHSTVEDTYDETGEKVKESDARRMMFSEIENIFEDVEFKSDEDREKLVAYLIDEYIEDDRLAGDICSIIEHGK